MTRKAVFFDRDGTLVKPVMRAGHPGPPLKPEELEIVPEAEEVVRQIKGLGFIAVLVTNQPDIAYGKISVADWTRIQAEVEKKFDFDDVEICFHNRDSDCECKKPKPGLILKSCRKFGLDLSQSFMVGDTASDTGAAAAAGCRSILVRRPYNANVKADFCVCDLLEAVELVRALER